MKHYNLSAEQSAANGGFTDLFQLAVTDMQVSGQFDAKTIILTTLAVGDIVAGAAIEVVTAIAGPTDAPTALVKVTTDNVVICPTCAVVTAKGSVTNNTIVGAHTVTQVDSLSLLTGKALGNGAAASAGELRVWARILRKATRNMIQA